MISSECICRAYLEFLALILLRSTVQCTKSIGLFGVVSCGGGRSVLRVLGCIIQCALGIVQNCHHSWKNATAYVHFNLLFSGTFFKTWVQLLKMTFFDVPNRRGEYDIWVFSQQCRVPNKENSLMVPMFGISPLCHGLDLRDRVLNQKVFYNL